MQDCKVCGRSFDPLSFQVVVPELARGFDRIECARSARILAGPGSRVAATPLVAIVEPLAADMPAALRPGPALRPLAAPAATLGLLAAGTAVAAVLWVRVLGADLSSFTLGRLGAPPAFVHETVQAHVEATPVGGAPAAAGKTPRGAKQALAAEGPTAPSAPPVPAGPETPPVTGGGESPGPSPPPGPSPEPSGPPVPTRPPTHPHGSELARVTGKGHPKHGKGHCKHGETDGSHSPGHGRAQGKGRRESEARHQGTGKHDEHSRAEGKGSGRGQTEPH